MLLCFRQQPRENPALAKYQLVVVPKASRLLKRGDRLAICGDSITEQKMYSRLMEDYLTMCAPELEVTVRQYGWGGERATGFLGRMTNDCLRFKPTIATTCYGMNDHEYRPYEDRIGRYLPAEFHCDRRGFQSQRRARDSRVARVCGQSARLVKTAGGTVDDLNLNLAKLRNIGIEIARNEKAGFADVFWPMLAGGTEARKLYGTNYAIAGGDGIHPGWAGHTRHGLRFSKVIRIGRQYWHIHRQPG